MDKEPPLMSNDHHISLFYENIISAIESIRLHRLRSVLNVLGIVVAISSVNIINSLGRAAEMQISNSLNALGSRLLLVYSAPQRDIGGINRGTLTQRDAVALRRAIPNIERVVPQLSSSVRVVAGRYRAETSLRGTDQGLFSITPLEFKEGGVFKASHVRERALVAVVGRTVADRLFPNSSALGQRVRINNVPVRLIGVAGARGVGFAGDQNDFILMPITTMRQRFGSGLAEPDAVGLLLVQFSEKLSPEAAREAVLKFFARQKHISPDETNPIAVTSSEELTRATSAIIDTVQAVLAAIASISLIVGAIGIANIMLVSVTERTREIGIRMALGAQPSDIKNQFLTESAVLCLIGAIIGIILSGLILLAIRWVTGFSVTLDIQSAIFVLLMSGIVGLLAGLLPAQRAANLDPVVALRYE